MKTKNFYLAVAALLLVGSVAAVQPEQSHNLSEIHPMDELVADLNVSNQDIFNVSELRMRNGLQIDGTAVQDPGNVNVLEWDSANSEWDFRNGDVNLNGNALTGVGATQCPSGEALLGDGSCGSTGSNQNLSETLANGNSAGSYNIRMNGNDIKGLDEIKGIGDIDLYSGTTFQLYGGTFEIYDTGTTDGYKFRVNDDGGPVEVFNTFLDINNNRIVNVSDPSNAQDAATKSYVDTSDDTIADDQNLQDVLSQGNSANRNIDMNGYSLSQQKKILHSGSGVEIEFNNSNNYIDFDQYNAEKSYLRIKYNGGSGGIVVPNGNVGIRDASPSGRLDISTATADDSGIYLNGQAALTTDGGANNWVRINQNSAFAKGTYTPDQVRADDGFNVDGNKVITGSGSFTPAGKLNMNGNDIKEVDEIEETRRAASMNSLFHESFEDGNLDNWAKTVNNNGGASGIQGGGQTNADSPIGDYLLNMEGGDQYTYQSNIDLSAVEQPVISFYWACRSCDGEGGYLYVSKDGGSSWTMERRLRPFGGAGDENLHYEEVDLSGYGNNADVRIRFEGSPGGGDDFAVDNINIKGRDGLSVTSSASAVAESNTQQGALLADEPIFVNDNNGIYVAGEDLAENYHSTQKLEEGELVRISHTRDNSVVRTSEAYGPVAGVVSTNPGYTLGMAPGKENHYPIALTGKVPVKVSTENGDIKKGDRIVPSSTPGVGMKCEMEPLDETDNFTEFKKISEANRRCRDSTVGKALESADTKTKILVKVNG